MENKGNILTKPLIVVLFAMFCCALWGSANPGIKIGYLHILPGDMKTVPGMMLFAGMRFALAGLITIIIYSIARRKFLYPKLSNVGRVLGVSAFQTVIQYIFFFIGVSNTSGVKSAIFSGSSAFFAVLISCLIFRLEKLTLKKILACLFGFAGIIIINLEGLNFNMTFTGDVFVLFSAVASAISSVLMKMFSKHEDPVIISGYQFFIGGLVMIVIGLCGGASVKLDTPAAWGILLYLAVLSAVAYSLWSLLLKYNSVSKVTIYSFMIPIFGVFLSLLMLPDEKPASILCLIITLVLVPLGIFLVNYNGSLIPSSLRNKFKKDEAEPEE